MSKKIIDAKALLSNIKILKEKSNSKMFCAVVKANAYGHGAREIVSLLKNKVDYFAVANQQEALEIAKKTGKAPVIVLSPQICPKIRKKIEFTVASFKDVEVLEKQGKKVFVHLKINTGMNRFGAGEKEAKAIFEQIKKCKFVKLKGIFTHFAFAENRKILKKQKEEFERILKILNPSKKVIIHASNTIASLKGTSFDMCRCGLGLYGFGGKNLLPVMQIVSEIVDVREVKKGQSVGYSGGFVASKKTKIAVVKIGYADGFSRAYSGAEIYISQKKCKVIGNVCMDCLFVDVSKLKNVKIGDKAQIISRKNTAEKLAKRSGKITYEVLCGFNSLR